MAKERAYALTVSEKQAFDRMADDWQRRPKGPGAPAPSLADPRNDWNPPIVAVLLDALDAGQSVLAEVLALRSYNQIQVITAYGQPNGGYFRVGFTLTGQPGSEVFTPLVYPMMDGPDVLQKYLSAIPAIGNGNVEVTLGLKTTDDTIKHNTWRWLVVFCGKFSGQKLPRLKVEDALTGGGLIVQSVNPLETTGRLETIHEVLGVTTPSPLRAGARCMASWISGIGYCIHACEVRDFGDYGLFLE